MKTAAFCLVLAFCQLSFAETIAVKADGTGSAQYPIAVAPGDMIDATISVDYELPVSSIRESYPPRVIMMSGESSDGRLVPSPVNWESYSAEVVDGMVRLQLEMPPVGESVTIHQQVTHDRSYVTADGGNTHATESNSPRNITIQLTVESATETMIKVNSSEVKVFEDSQEIIVMPEQVTDEMGFVAIREPLPAGTQVVLPVRVGKPQFKATALAEEGEAVSLFRGAGDDFSWGGEVYPDAQFDWGSFSTVLEDDGTILFSWIVPKGWDYCTITQQVKSDMERLQSRPSSTPPLRSQIQWDGIMVSIQTSIAE